MPALPYPPIASVACQAWPPFVNISAAPVDFGVYVFSSNACCAHERLACPSVLATRGHLLASKTTPSRAETLSPARVWHRLAADVPSSTWQRQDVSTPGRFLALQTAASFQRSSPPPGSTAAPPRSTYPALPPTVNRLATPCPPCTARRDIKRPRPPLAQLPRHQTPPPLHCPQPSGEVPSLSLSLVLATEHHRGR
jgi:hypothetical protein